MGSACCGTEAAEGGAECESESQGGGTGTLCDTVFGSDMLEVESYPSVSRGVLSALPPHVLSGVAGHVCVQAWLGTLCSHAILRAACLGHFLPGWQPGSRVLLGVERGRMCCQDAKAEPESRGKRGAGLELSIPGREGKSTDLWLSSREGSTETGRGLPPLQGRATSDRRLAA